VHLFMQFRLRKEDSIGWSHFVSRDLVQWSYLGEPIQPDGKTSCPDSQGCFTGSATIVDGVPSLMYPGVHTVTPPPASGVGPYVDMGQCLALPEDVTDPLLRRWSKRLVIPSDSKKINSSRLHDDSAAWRGEDGRWWMFVAGSKTLPLKSRPRARKYGLNLLYSSADFRSWRREHSLFDIITSLEPDGSVNKSDRGSECPFVSCPELYRAPGMGKPDSKCRRKLHSLFSPLRIILWMQIETNDPRFHFVAIAGLRTVL
jgi:sucrose-6-phosphate hydrolase SacC (GH32 family)